ncbi:MFS transporter [Streptomyces sp. 142MFCol3.1]|uniref:MFS transporter n=1 Tax=Streptomyces sp. 142MFCol3.1 TaxID=1172179 RepID=UPI0004013ED8|nr:MFS transporter [Streptomyces sp. 142MFCol3.1]
MSSAADTELAPANSSYRDVLLRNRRMAGLLLGDLLANAGTGMLIVAMPVQTLAVHGSLDAALAIAMVEAAPFLLSTVLALAISLGRFSTPPRRLLLADCVLRAVAFTGLGALAVADRLTLPVLVGGLLLGSTCRMAGSSSRRLLATSMVGDADRFAVNGLLGLGSNFALLVVGPVAGGMLVAWAGTGWALFADACGALILLVSVLRCVPRAPVVGGAAHGREPENASEGRPPHEAEHQPAQTSQAPSERTPQAPSKQPPGAPSEQTPGAPSEQTSQAPSEQTPQAPSKQTSRVPSEQTPEREPRRESGWRVLRRRPVAGHLLVVVFFFNFLYMPIEVALPLYVRDTLHSGASGLGLLWTALGAGALAGAALVDRLRGLPQRPLLVAVIALWALCPIALAGIADQSAAMVVFGLGGLVWAPFTPIAYSFLQSGLRDDEQQPVVTLWTTGSTVAAPLGLLAGGPLIALTGLRTSLVLSGLLTMLLAVLAAWSVARGPR